MFLRQHCSRLNWLIIEQTSLLIMLYSCYNPTVQRLSKHWMSVLHSRTRRVFALSFGCTRLFSSELSLIAALRAFDLIPCTFLPYSYYSYNIFPFSGLLPPSHLVCCNTGSEFFRFGLLSLHQYCCEHQTRIPSPFY